MEGILTLSNMCALQHIEISQVHVHKAKNSLLLSRELGAVVMVRTLSVSADDDIFLLGEDMIFSSGSFHQWKRLLTSATSISPAQKLLLLEVCWCEYILNLSQNQMG